MSRRFFLCCPLVALLALSSGCSTLGGNVAGNFACRAPEGNCAPTSLIDAAATGIAAPATRGQPTSAPALSDARSLRIVLAAHRDAAGRTHEARVVHVTLPEPVGASWRAPTRSAEVLRAIGDTIAAEYASPSATLSEIPAQLPDVLFPPWQPVPAVPGTSVPDPGAPDADRAARIRVPHPSPDQGDRQ